MAGRKKNQQPPDPDAGENPAVPEPEPADPGITFEEALAEVEEIVEELESDQIPLDRLIERYEQGTRLLEVCRARIESAEARIEMIAAARGGGKTLEPFDPEDGEPGGSASAADTPDRSLPDQPAIHGDDDEDDDGNDDIRLF